MSKQGLSPLEFVAHLYPRHRRRPLTAAHLRAAATLASLHESAPNGEGQFEWKPNGKHEMVIVVDAAGLWRRVKAPQADPVTAA